MSSSINEFSLLNNHLERTANIQRQGKKVPATIISIIKETPTVKSFILKPEDPLQINFFPGQWLDVFTEIPIVGGFSITSTPRHFRLTQTLNLAIKYSSHPPAKWFHEQATVGSVVNIRVGGNFIYNREDEKKNDIQTLLFVAGGAGINPLVSMITSLIDGRENDRRDGSLNGIQKIWLMYSARTRDELLFFQRIEQLKEKSKGFLECSYFLTRKASSSFDPEKENSGMFRYERISQVHLTEIINKIHLPHLKSFICGPGQMEVDIIGWLRKAGLKEKQISFERW
ncbi:hypothetical protein G9A89_008289 [Geosiphon pyriformis]|nr:hypothetical protein G9A89_008289 [Geosiphon pyriformis]